MILESLSIAEGRGLAKSTFIKGVGEKKSLGSEIPLKFGEKIFRFGEFHPRVRDKTALVSEIEFPNFRLVRKNRLAIGIRTIYNENN